MEEPRTSTGNGFNLDATPSAGDGLASRHNDGSPTPSNRWSTPPPDQRLVAETLEWIAGELGTKRARFVRLLSSGLWIVQTAIQGKLIAQPANRAEIAMAWTVSLSREIYCAARPRVVTIDGSGIRPIAVTSYIAIPVLCQQGLAGIIEAAGDLRPEADRIAQTATGRLREFATRLMFDPGLRAAPSVTIETECAISTGLGSPNLVSISDSDWTFLCALTKPMTLAELAAVADFDEEHVIDKARSLVARGLITLRTPTCVLMTSNSPPKVDQRMPAPL